MSELIEINEFHYTRVDGEPVVIVHEDTLKALYKVLDDALIAMSRFMPTPVEGYKSDPTLLVGDILRLGREREAMREERDSARTLSALSVVGVVTDDMTLSEAKKHAEAITEALRLSREALESSELCWLWDDDSRDFYMCCWSCWMTVDALTEKPRHAPACKRLTALAALRGVTQ